jgi:hypothetical protein
MMIVFYALEKNKRKEREAGSLCEDLSEKLWNFRKSKKRRKEISR